MAQVISREAIEAAVREGLSGTRYAVLSLTPLGGGMANFIYRAELETPLANGAAEVLVKHGEGYVAQHPEYPLTRLRCEIEVESLRLLSSTFPNVSWQAYDVGTPRVFFFDAQTSTQVQEYLPNATNLKDYAIRHYQSPTRWDAKPQCVQLGQALGRWLRAFHGVGGRDGQEAQEQNTIRAVLSRNSEMRAVKKMINYDWLLLRMDDFSGLVGGRERSVVQDIADMAAAEMRDESRLDVIHGDFWTGKCHKAKHMLIRPLFSSSILLPDAAIQTDGPTAAPTPIKIIDWELAHVGIQCQDVGQLIAELWLLKLYRNIEAGVWVIQGFVDGYGKTETSAALRALLHVGAHLVCWGSTTPGWGTRRQNEEVARMGWRVLFAAWAKDVSAFGGHDLECVLG